MATPWDMTLARGRTATINYTVMLNNSPVNLTGLTDLRWTAKVKVTDADNATGVLVKSFLAGGLTIISATAGTIQVRLDPADTAAPAFTPTPQNITVYLGLVLYMPGIPLVEYDLFGGLNPSLLLQQGVLQAIT